MSGDFYFYCQDCFSQWFTDGEGLGWNQVCYNCGSGCVGGGDLGKEGDMAILILDAIRDTEELYHENHTELYRFAQKVFRKYFEPEQVDDEDFYDEDEFNERMKDY